MMNRLIRHLEFPLAVVLFLVGSAFLLKMCYLSLLQNTIYGSLFLLAFYAYVRVRVQQRDAAIQSDLAWRDVAADVATVQKVPDGSLSVSPDMTVWAGTVSFAQAPAAGRFRLLIEESEFVSANYTLTEGREVRQPGRLIYAEAFELDDALVSET